MIYKKKIIFVTATRADFGKLKSLIKILKGRKEFKVYIVVTGMHMIGRFGYTYSEVTKVIKSKIIKFKNQLLGDNLEIILTKTTEKFSKIVNKINPDLIVIHGDRVETLACAVVGSLNHILTAHIEGGEVSGTIDDTIRHAVTKLSHIHFVGTKNAKDRIIKMGEINNHIFIKGLQPKYRESEKVRFRIGCRKKYVQKTFTESVYNSSFHVPEGSGLYSFVDVGTNTTIVPFSAYTSMSCDSTSMYFDQWLNTFEPGRYYKVLFKLKYNDGQEIIYDNDEEFKVI